MKNPNMEACSCNHFCREKAVCITYSDCVFVALGKMRMRIIITCGLSGYAIFFHITSKQHDFREKIIEHKICVFTFSTPFM